jgi:hypothetical protein
MTDNMHFAGATDAEGSVLGWLASGKGRTKGVSTQVGISFSKKT